MPSYPPRADNKAKRDRLESRISELRRAMSASVGPKPLEALTEKVRQAKIALLKAERHRKLDARVGGTPVTTALDKIEKEIQLWNELSVDQIREKTCERKTA